MTATTRLGEVLRDDGGVRLAFERTFDSPAADVWEALTDPERLGRWFGTWTGDPSTGAVEVVMTGEDDASPQPVAIEACEPPHRLVVRLGSDDGPWPLEVELAERAGATHLRFVHHLAEPFDASGVGPGWHYYLDWLAAVVAGAPPPSDFAEYHPALAASYPVPAPPAPAPPSRPAEG